jgi:hypothetical protein
VLSPQSGAAEGAVRGRGGTAGSLEVSDERQKRAERAGGRESGGGISALYGIVLKAKALGDKEQSAVKELHASKLSLSLSHTHTHTLSLSLSQGRLARVAWRQWRHVHTTTSFRIHGGCVISRH